jgi:cyclophilin family peptidyl-prolyl cis-trans isomerase
MIGTLTKLFGRLVRGSDTTYTKRHAKGRFRRIAIEPLETRRLLAATGSISGSVYFDPANAGALTSADEGFAGMTVELLSVGSSGGTTLVSPGGIRTTGADGSYNFPSVAAGTYQVQISPSSRLVVGNLSPGSAGGTAGTNDIQLTLAAGQAATDYNFAILGVNPSYISARMDISSAGTLANFVSKSLLTPPTVASSGGGAGASTYTSGGSPVNVAPSATVDSTESSNLLWLTATIENPAGSGDQLSATIPSGSGLSSNFSGDVLTISGPADAATYQSALQSITYSTSSSPSGTNNPTIRVEVSDGTTQSAVYTTTIAIAPGSQVAPTISTQPAAASVNAGGTATFTAAAGGTPSPTVQWEVSTNGGSTFTAISGATSTTYSFTPTAADNENEYEAVFTNSAGTATTSAALLKVDSVTTQPASQAINAGANATFTAASSNSGDTVQWEVNSGSGFTALSNGGVYSGVTTTTLTITAATTSLGGNQYEAIFTNSAGTLTTSAAALTVNAAPTVTTNPAAALVDAGGNATFTAAASGTPTPSVQWMVNTGSGFADATNGGVYSGATTGTLTITGATAAMNGYTYEAVFTNSSGPATSSAAALTVDSITTQPASQTINAGANATFTAASSNSGDTVQWEVNSGSGFTPLSNGGVYSGVTTATLTITVATASLGGNQYEAIFTNSAGTLTTSVAALTVNAAPSVTTQPSAELAEAGGNATFTAVAAGSPAPSVQWMVDTGSGFADATNGGVYSGATTGTLTITGATAAMNGYTYEAVCTNSSGSATSSAAALTVDSITTQPASQTINAGANTTFTAASSYSGDIVIWELNTGSGFTSLSNGGGYSGVLTTTLTITGASASLNGNQYEAVFSNLAGKLTTSAATLTVNGAAPTVTTNPTAVSASAGGNATFTAAASGSPTPSVQWMVNTGSGFDDVTDGPITGGGSYSGATTGTLTITGATAAMNGYSYEAVFSNSGGTATSSSALLTVVNYSVTADQALLGPSNDAAASFTIGGVAQGDTYTYKVTSSGGSGTVSNSGTVTATGQSQQVTVNVSTLAAGTLTYSVQVTHDGITGAAVTATTVLDETPPTGYSVVPNNTAYGAAQISSGGFTIAGGAAGDTYIYQISSSNGGTPISGSGTMSSASAVVGGGIDLAPLNDGTLSFSVTLTDSVGNVGQAVTATASLDRVAPSGYTVGGLPATFGNATAEDVGFTINSPTAENGDTFTYTISSSGSASGASVSGSGTISSTAQQLSSVNVSSLANGTLTFSVILTDAAGNVGAPATGTATLAQLAITSTPATSATVGQVYTYTVQTNAPAGDTVAVTPGTSLPAGMSFDAATNTFTWTPTADQAGTSLSFTASVTDSTAGNTVTLGPVYVEVAAANGLTVVAPADDVASGSPVLVSFSDANAGTPNYTITTSSSDDPTGSNLTATLLPQTNQVLKIVTNEGEMDFQLFNNFTPSTVQHFVDLVNSGTYNQSTYDAFTGTFTLQVGTATTAPITFDATDLATTATNIQAALEAALPGVTAAVSVAPGAAYPAFSFDVTFSTEQSPVGYTAAATPLPVTFSNSATAAADMQTLTFTTPDPDFYRILSTFVNQGGIGGSATATPIPDELNSNLRFTSSGLLAMANNGVDGNSTEFFMTNPDDMSDGFLDFRYTIFGKLISGDNVRADLASTPVTTNSSGEDSQPLTPPKILSMSVVSETTGGGVLELQAAPGATVGDTYTVTVNDGLGNSQSFQIHIGFSGPLELQVGSSSTGQINFDSGDPAATAANMQSALQAAGVTGATVAVAADSTASSLAFTVTFPTAQPAVTATTTDLPVTFSNSVTTSATSQELTFNVTNAGAYDPPNAWVEPINGTDTISTAANTPVTFTPVGQSADGSAVTTNVQLLLDIPSVPGAEVDSSFLSTSTASSNPAQNPNPNLTLTANQDGSYTLTPAAGYYGVQLLEVMGYTSIDTTSPVTPGHGTYQLQVGSTTTAPIDFDTDDLVSTAANIQSALAAAGFSGATVQVDPTTTAPNFVFDVTFASSEADISYEAPSTDALPLTFANAATAAAASQTITFTATGASWDSSSGVDPVYRAIVPVYVAPPAPVLASITASGQTVSGSTTDNNSSPATALSFNVTGAIAGATVSVYMDGSTTPIATGAVASGDTTVTLTTDGATVIGDGPHTFTVKQTVATPATTAYVNWSASNGPGTEFGIRAGSVVSGPSLGVGLTIDA